MSEKKLTKYKQSLVLNYISYLGKPENNHLFIQGKMFHRKMYSITLKWMLKLWRLDMLCICVVSAFEFQFTLLRADFHHHHHHHVQEGLGLIPVPCILKMKLVPPSLPRSSYVSSSFWFIL